MLFKSDTYWIKKSDLFDADYYLETNSDVKKIGMNPLKHFVKYGWKEGRNPSGRFNTSFYLSTYTDVKNAGINPLVHYIKFGQREGRLPKKSFHALSFKEPWITNQTNMTEDVLYQGHSNILNIFKSKLYHASTKHMTIITPKHTLFVAHLLYKSLVENGFKIQIKTTLPEKFDDNLHIMICPQIFDRMPEHYIAFQMEQLESSKWFNESYRIILQNSIAIFDYSIQNIAYLQSHGFSQKCLFHLPITPFDEYQKFLLDHGHWDVGETDTCDVLFYGDPHNERRQNYLRALQHHFSVKIINGMFGNDLYRELLSAKVIVNIHYYENALLETTRIYECLSLGLKVVSEESSDMEEHLTLLNQVDFVRIGDIDHMIEKISQVLEKEKVSVVIPCYNQAAYIQETIESVLEQTYPNLEIIIVNDGSTDESEKNIREISRNYPNKNIHLINQTNKGLSEARNSGIKNASGEYIFTLDADDKLDKNIIQKGMNAMLEHNVDIVYTYYKCFGERNNIVSTISQVNLYFIQYSNITGATALYKKDVWEKTGGYKQNMDIGYEDWEFWINAAKNGFKFYNIPSVLFYYRVKKESRDTEAIKKDAYLKAKIVMNHPELYTSTQRDNALNTIKTFEDLPDVYFYFDDKIPSNEKEIISLITNSFHPHKLNTLVQSKETCIITSQNTRYSIHFSSLESGVKYIKPDVDHIIVYYAKLKYSFSTTDTIKKLICSSFAWHAEKGIVQANGTTFPFRYVSSHDEAEANKRSNKFQRYGSLIRTIRQQSSDIMNLESNINNLMKKEKLLLQKL